MASNIPLTLAGGIGGANELYIGENRLNSERTANTFWFVVFDMENPMGKPLAVEQSDSNSTVPATIKSLAEKPNTLLCFSFNEVFAFKMPTGELYEFLISTGASRQLRRVEQIVEQSGSNFLSVAFYQLVATLDTNDEPGIEALDWHHAAILTCKLMPVEIGGKTVYTPVQLS